MSEIINTLASTQTAMTSLLLGASVLACLVSVLLCLRGSKKNRLLEQKLSKLERDLRIANNSAVAMGQDLIGLEKRVHAQHKQSEVTPKMALEPVSQTTEIPYAKKASPLTEDSVYDEARKLLAQGIGVQTVAKRSGLSFAEVSLLDSLSKSSATSH